MNATCPKCQTENLTTAKFCKKCGSPLGEVQGISNIAIADDKLYEIAMEEIENNSVQKGLYARAFSQSEGDKDKTDALYIKFRVQSLQDELVLEAEQERTLKEEHNKEKLLKEQKDKEEALYIALRPKNLLQEFIRENGLSIYKKITDTEYLVCRQNSPLDYNVIYVDNQWRFRNDT